MIENFTKYDQPRKGTFSVHKTDPAIYNKNGWVCVPVQDTIIGEDEDTYVTRILDSSYDEWVGDTKRTVKGKICMGYHKSRLIKWDAVQLSLF